MLLHRPNHENAEALASTVDALVDAIKQKHGEVEVIFLMDGPMEEEEAHKADARFRRVVVSAGSHRKMRYAAYAAVPLGYLRSLNRLSRLATGEKLLLLRNLRPVRRCRLTSD